MWVLGGTLITGAIVSLDTEAPPPGAQGFVIRAGRIASWIAKNESPPADAHVLDFRPHTLAPGTIDVHTHGAVGCSFSSGPEDDTLAICRYRAQTGCTGLLATITGEWDELLAALQKLGRLTGTETGGALLHGIHVEGPFLNPVRKGAISETTLRPPSIDDLRRMQEAAGGAIRMMTVAPELPGALPVIEEMRRLQIVPSVGHSDATFEETLAGVESGICKSTHTFNAMRPLHHREPGVVGAVMSDERIVAEVIPDGAHVHPAVVRALLAAKGRSRVVYVTDGVRYAGLDEGVYERPGRGRATVEGGIAVAEDGTIAGSVSPMDRNIGLMQRNGVGAAYSFHAAADQSARLLGLTSRGVLKSGNDADFGVYDADYRCVATFIGGRRVWAAPR